MKEILQIEVIVSGGPTALRLRQRRSSTPRRRVGRPSPDKAQHIITAMIGQSPKVLRMVMPFPPYAASLAFCASRAFS